MKNCETISGSHLQRLKNKKQKKNQHVEDLGNF